MAPQIPYTSALMAECKTPFLPPYSRAIKEVLSRGDYVRLETVKSAGRVAFSPEHGGSYDEWSARPLSQLLIFYLTIDLCALFKVRDRFMRGGAAPRGFCQAEVAKASAERAAKTFEKGGLPWAHGREWNLLDFSCLSSNMMPARLPQLTVSQSDSDMLSTGLRNFSFASSPGGSDSPARVSGFPTLADVASGRDGRSYGSGGYDSYAAVGPGALMGGSSSGARPGGVAQSPDRRSSSGSFPPIGGTGRGVRPAAPAELPPLRGSGASTGGSSQGARLAQRSSSCVEIGGYSPGIKSAAF